MHARSLDGSLDTLRRAQFAVIDILRRAQGDAFGAFGLGPSECPYRVVASGRHWRLRRYAARGALPALFVIAAPIKRPYIWDLAPSVSAIRYCLKQHRHVYLLEWMPASRHAGNNGLDEYAQAVSECVAIVARETSGARPFLMGHSLGGTLAAIVSAFAPETIRGLVLLGAPLCFQPAASRFRDALVSLFPSAVSETGPFPGSLLSLTSSLASPRAFIWSRLADAAFSSTDFHALEIHARVERWALDEVPLPGKLVYQIVEWLYREDRLCRGALTIGGAQIGPATLSVPTLAVVNTDDDVAPLASVRPFIDAMPTSDVHVIECPGEVGVCLQHLGILIGPAARARIWPDIIAWLDMHC
jgi:polyhydroxyalkanoate synthase